jgi:hypothetical protein
MNLATLSVEGEDSALATIAEQLPLKHEQQWKKGDPRRNGKVHSSSGFQITVADAKNPGELTKCIHAFLAQCKESGIVFPEKSLVAELSVGFTVGDSEQFVAGVEFLPAELLLLSQCGIALSVTAYPTSDEANAG